MFFFFFCLVSSFVEYISVVYRKTNPETCWVKNISFPFLDKYLEKGAYTHGGSLSVCSKDKRPYVILLFSLVFQQNQII